jgi:hypothetical protein
MALVFLFVYLADVLWSRAVQPAWQRDYPLRHSARHYLLAGIAGALAIFFSSFINWHVFAVALSVVAATGAMLRYLYTKRPGRLRPSLALIVITLVAMAAAGIAWQLQPPVRIQTAEVIPLPKAAGLPMFFLATTKDEPLPYLGESSDYVFVAEIERASTSSFPTGWKYTNRIVEIPREGVRLIFPEQKGTLNADFEPPVCLLRLLVRHSFGICR